MSHFSNTHITPLQALSRKGTPNLPHTQYISLTGEYAGTSSLSSATGRPDVRHIFMWVNVTTGKFEGVYEAAVDVHSNRPDGTAPDNEEVKYLLSDERVAEADWPQLGTDVNAKLSYEKLGLKESQFTLAEASDLHAIVINYATRCDRMTIFGMTYDDGTGIHDAHMNRDDQDGGVVFYFGSQNGGPVARWVFLKFQEPILPDA